MVTIDLIWYGTIIRVIIITIIVTNTGSGFYIQNIVIIQFSNCIFFHFLLGGIQVDMIIIVTIIVTDGFVFSNQIINTLCNVIDGQGGCSGGNGRGLASSLLS